MTIVENTIPMNQFAAITRCERFAPVSNIEMWIYWVNFNIAWEQFDCPMCLNYWFIDAWVKDGNCLFKFLWFGQDNELSRLTVAIWVIDAGVICAVHLTHSKYRIFTEHLFNGSKRIMNNQEYMQTCMLRTLLFPFVFRGGH